MTAATPRIFRVSHPVDGTPTLACCVDDRLFAVDGTIEDCHRRHRRGEDFSTGTALGALSTAQILTPVQPSKVVCVGLNYIHHAEEMNKAVPEEPLLFLKPPTAVIGPGEFIELPPASSEVHHEGELAIVIGNTLRDATEEEAMAAVFGYTCACDITARDIQRREKRYTRAKGFDTFAPMGPAIALAPGFIPAHHGLRCAVNGELRQESSLDDFIFPIPFVLSFISRIMTLAPGDVVLTGTPAGVGPIKSDDTVTVRIDGIGTLENPVRPR